MDFRFSEREEALREEIREFAKKELPPDWLSIGYLAMEAVDWDFTVSIGRKLAQKGWTTRNWPKEYGGAGASPMENTIFQEEIAYWGIPISTSGGFMGIMICHLGTEEQKKKYLPPMAAADPDVCFCLGYSEPDAGTDLAAVSTRAVRVGNEYIVNGQKIWTSLAHRAHYCWTLVRTNPDVPKHKGLSVMILDLKQPGVTIKPLIDIAGTHVVNEVFFDDARVPVTELVGEENGGWSVVMAALDFERAGIFNVGLPRRILDELVNYVKETRCNGEPLSKNPFVRHKLANMALEIEIGQMISYKIAWLEGAGTGGLVPAMDASMMKVFLSEALIRQYSTAMEIVGPYAQLRPGSKWAKLQGQLEGAYLMSFPNRFAGGTNDIQRDIIARFALGLPRAPKV